MPIIPNFPVDLMDQHHHWHDPSAHGGAGPGRMHPMGTPGGGFEFFTFHRNFMAQFHAWYDSHTFTVAPFNDAAQKASLVAATWHGVPDELKDSTLGWNSSWQAADERLTSGMPDFSSDDELGTFIETGIHNNFLHGAAAIHFNEPVLGSFHSPQSTYFYKIHGLVDWWWSQWQMRNKAAEIPKLIVVEVDAKTLNDNVKNRIAEVKDFTFEVKKLNAAENLNFIDPLFDPKLMLNLQMRIRDLEWKLQQGSTFIKPAARPDVDKALVRKVDRVKK